MGYHFIGIGGIGMSALAHLLRQKNIKVKGSDITNSFLIEKLRQKGVEIYLEQKKENIDKNDIVIYGSAIKENNEEYAQAKKAGQIIMHRSELLQELLEGHFSIAVTGTHGKTTSSSLLSEVLTNAKLDPSYALGGILNSSNTNANLGKGKYFVVEADESDGSFLKYFPSAAIITNLEKDHLDFWKTEENLQEGFSKFIKKIKNKSYLFWCYEDPVLRSMSIEGLSYGFSDKADIYASNVRQSDFSTFFDIHYKGYIYKDIQLGLLGRHNVLNALAIFGLLCNLNISVAAIQEGFKSFKGIKRRLDKIENFHQTLFLDDYAHHPSEIKATLMSLRECICERKMIVLFQPHRYSRSSDLFDEFSSAFDMADEVFITDIYAAGEKPGKVTAEKLVENVNNPKCSYLPNEKIFEIVNRINPLDVVIFLGAGDITNIAKIVAAKYREKAKKIKLALLFGGKSCEHSVSICSAKCIYENLDKDIYDIKLIYISKDGKLKRVSHFDCLEDEKVNPLIENMEKLVKDVDVCFPALHGPGGEDGMIQAFFETIGKAYVGASYAACSCCMNKFWTKAIAEKIGVKTAKYIALDKVSYLQEKEKFIKKIILEIGFPLFFKAAHLGSSIGVEKVNEATELEAKIERVLPLDSMFIVEQAIFGQEIETAVLGNSHIKVASPGEILTFGCFYDFDKKYNKPLQTQVPANLTKEQEKEVKQLSIDLYRAIGLEGMARIDFFFKDEQFYLNEINPIPGFTSASLYPKMWLSSNVKYKDLLNTLVVLALHKKRICR